MKRLVHQVRLLDDETTNKNHLNILWCVMIPELPTILGLFGGYIITSFVFFKYPHILHKRKYVAFIARHISHRGGAGESYENTMTAFKRAVDFGTDMLELDCQITKDGKVVVAHDNNLIRLAGIDANISSLLYNELPLLQEAVPIDFKPGQFYKDEMPEKADRQIPLLEDLFKTFKRVPINIDIKEDDDSLIEGVATLIQQYNREKYCVWGNATTSITEKCYKRNPNVNLLCSKRKVLIMLLCYYTGLLPFIPLKETHFEICLPSVYLSRYPQRMIHQIIFKIAENLLIRKSLFTHLKKRGIQVYLWVLNEDHEFERAFQVGATGVMTDYPTRLGRFIESNINLIYDENCQQLPTNAL